MSSMKDLIIYQKFYDLILYAFPIINKFPKNQRFMLGQQIQNCLLDIAKLIIQANEYGKNQYRLNTLYQIDIELEKLKLFIRLCVDLQFINFHRYSVFCSKFSEIGKLLGGWIKVTKGA